jgi:serine/threonine protein kinase
VIARPTEVLAREVFDQVASLPEGSDERTAILERLRRENPTAYDEVSSLLHSSDSRHIFLDHTGAASPLNLTNRIAINDEPVTSVGKYKIVRKLGQGGMGVVYEARQEFPNRSVALKLLRPDVASPSMLRRFELEAEALGMLHHPGIANIFEAGRSKVNDDERMFIAMELVQGPSLSRFIKDTNPSRTARIELIAQIADAVDHAHRRGVVHRDLKPGNVIIDQPASQAGSQPKVLDFGVARLGSESNDRTMNTRAGQLIGTLEYMSPEQLSGDPRAIDSRTDVYALGVMLYEALTGDLPLDLSGKNLFSAIDLVRKHEPRRVSKVLGEGGGGTELDDIVAMAMEKDPQHRYQSASALADDLRRLLRNEPVQAHPQTTWYQARKFAQRHAAFVGAIAAVIVALSAGLIAALWQADRANRAQKQVAAQLVEVERLNVAEKAAREKAETDKKTTQAVAGYLVALLEKASPEHTAGKEMTIREALDKTAGTVEADFRDQPVVLMRLNDVIRQTYGSLGDFTKAERHGRRALELSKQIFEGDPATWSDEAGDLSVALIEGDKADEAIALLRDTLAQTITQVGEDHEAVATLQMHLGSALRAQEQYEEAETLLRKSLAFREKSLGMEDRATMVVLNELSLAVRGQGRFSEAEQMTRRNRDTTVKNLGPDHPDALAAATNLANLLDTLGREDEAISLLRDTLERAQRVLGPAHPTTLQITLGLGTTLIDTNNPKDAVAVLEPALAGMRETFGPEHQTTLNLLNNLANAYERSGDLDKASSTFASLREIMLRKEPESMRTAITLGNSGRVELARKQPKLAVQLTRQALDIGEKNLPPDHALRLRLTIGYAAALIGDGRIDEALALAEPVYAQLAEKHGPGAGPPKGSAKTIAEALAKASHPQAAKWLERANTKPPEAPATPPQ